ncbi:MAG: bis(5'-nucleosyl)-tetraphosphatase (symmetrical) YqeK [Anaerovoracaceae bacterium]|nr:bis(5'-nucleosyl)-tetraphosphatase (symmetrical) YqeK [Anaerovoracaceae bacterium]
MNISSTYDSLKRTIEAYIENNATEKRKIHTEGVRQTAIKLAEKYGPLDEELRQKAELTALFHDMYRGVSTDVLNYYVKHLGLDEKRYKNNANLAHGKIAAAVMEREYGITDNDMLNAVSFHTTGRPGMSLLEKIIYIADAIEPNRSYPGVDELRKSADCDIDRACLQSLTNTIAYVRSENKYLDEDTILAREYFEKRIKEKGENI